MRFKKDMRSLFQKYHKITIYSILQNKKIYSTPYYTIINKRDGFWKIGSLKFIITKNHKIIILEKNIKRVYSLNEEIPFQELSILFKLEENEFFPIRPAPYNKSRLENLTYSPKKFFIFNLKNIRIYWKFKKICSAFLILLTFSLYTFNINEVPYIIDIFKEKSIKTDIYHWYIAAISSSQELLLEEENTHTAVASKITPIKQIKKKKIELKEKTETPKPDDYVEYFMGLKNETK